MTTIEDIKNNTELSMVSSVFGIVLGFLTVNLIKNYADMETLLFELKDETTDNNMEQTVPFSGN